jgi:putative peptidoglycan lipid II flippase
LGVITVVLTAALWLGAEWLTELQFGSFDPDTRALTIRLTRIVLPAQIFFVTGGIVRAVLMAHGRFGAQAAAPLIYNAGIIAGGLISGDIEGFAWGALVGAVLGAWAYPLYEMRHVGPLGARFAPWDPRFHGYLWRALPLMIGLSLTTVDEWYERWFGGRLGEGVIASLGFARRLMMAPVAVVGQAVAAAALPMLATMHAEGRERELDATLLRTLQATMVVAVLAAAGFFVFAEPIVDLVYRRGRFDAEDAARVASLLAILALAVPGWVTQQVAVRAFFARAETWRPMLLGTALALAAIPVYLGLGDHLGAEGLALAGVIAISANALLTLGWARQRYGGPSPLVLLGTMARATVIATPAALAGGWLGAWARGTDMSGVGGVIELGLGGAIFGLVSLLGIRLLGDEVMRETLAGLLDRLRRVLRRGRRPGIE